ncbi:hypothetical protein [Parvularcula lutaonensis]|uniref:Uncharacterized protein n=1 Tax=Parvularcula lutaonensis TaxID=491923 RepID=A0ABV7M940_9PROT|nr:hypothetical protein [Parvularcula lutaonensis]GGY42289.1 hypothetical protein GCM10007148_08670 [Parvularcula lutaonensis]
MSSGRFLENTTDELFDWCMVVLENAYGFYAERFPNLQPLTDQYERQRDLLEKTRSNDDLRGMRILSVDFFDATSRAHHDLVARVNDALVSRFGPDTALIPTRDERA